MNKETVEKVKSYLSDNKYSNLNHNEIALLCGTSATGVSEIANGQYDYLLDPAVNTNDVQVAIDYETLKHLIACENVVEAILKGTKLSVGYEGILFIDYKAVYGILRAYVPDEVNSRLEVLKEKEENNE